MSQARFQIIQAHGLLLDAPPRQIPAGVGAEFRRVAAEATFLTMENLLLACREQQPGLMVLTGSCWPGDCPTLRAERAWERLIAELQQHKIELLHCPPEGNDSCRPFHAALSQTGVHLLESPSRSPLLLHDRDGTVGVRLIAENAGAPRHLEIKLHSGRQDQSCLLAADEQAAATGLFPGPLQSLEAAQTGPLGGLRIQLHADQGVEVVPLPLSALRRETIQLKLQESHRRDALLAQMEESLSQLLQYPGEQARLCCWRIQGRGELFQSLADRSVQSGLFNELKNAVRTRWLVGHSLQLEPLAATESTLVREYRQAVQSIPLTDLIPPPEGGSTELPPAFWQQLIRRVDPAAVHRKALSLGLHRLDDHEN